MEMAFSPETLAAIRALFPALATEVSGLPAVFLDGPAGSQTPQVVIDAVSRYLATSNANHGGRFATSRTSDALLDRAHEAAADLIGATDPGEIIFGANMTTLTFSLSRALSKYWRPGDEIIVTNLDHDANVSPWVLAARDAGATVRRVNIRRDDCTLDLDDFRRQLNSRTVLVAVGCASNAVGTVNPVADICRWAEEEGAMTFIDAVHAAPHLPLDVAAWECDFLACSAYKFFGPHVGVLWGRRVLLEAVEAYRVRPAGDDLPGKWMTGTQNHEGIAGTLAAIDYLADLGRQHGGGLSRRSALLAAFACIRDHEQSLASRLLAGLRSLPAYKVWGITDPACLHNRLPTLGLTHRRLSPLELAEFLADRGIFAWHGNFYALPLTEALGLEPDGMLRVGFLHYNTPGEADRLLEALAELD